MPKDPAETKIKLVKVRVVRVTGPSAVVEWAGGLKRAVIPAAEVISDELYATVPADVLDEGAPYGLPWERLVKMEATPEKLADELHRNGIWTMEDVESNPRAIMGALQTVYGVELSTLIQAAHKEVRNVKR